MAQPFYTQRLNPATDIIATGYSVVNSWYHALMLTVRRPMSHGFELLVNYTYSKSLDDGAVQGFFGTFSGTDAILNPANVKQENSLSELDQRHRFVGSLVWRPARLPLKGFVFSAIATEASGQPVQANVSGFPSNGVNTLTDRTSEYRNCFCARSAEIPAMPPPPLTCRDRGCSLLLSFSSATLTTGLGDFSAT